MLTRTKDSSSFNRGGTEKDSEESLERWYQELETMVRENDAEELARLEAALQEADVVAKEQMRREMGLK
jgi:hypothetical protein